MSADFGCYGETAIKTPHLDRLAAEGARFDRAFTTGPICSISRSALITGRIRPRSAPSTTGRRAAAEDPPARRRPAGARLFKDAGYLTLNVRPDDFVRSEADVKADPRVGIAKTDYNSSGPGHLRPDPLDRPASLGQPFFAQVHQRRQAPRERQRRRVAGLGRTARWAAGRASAP